MRRPWTLDRRSFTVGLGALGGAIVLGCGSGDDGAQPSGPAAGGDGRLPRLASVKLTTERTIVPSRAVASPADARSPMDPTARASLVASGFGAYAYGPGEPLVGRMPDGSSAPAPGPNPRLLVRFAHLTDVHLTDDESPIRFERFDSPPPLDAVARPHAPYVGRMLNAAVRTLNAVHESSPLAFVLVGGDVVESAQQNELAWFLGTITGGAAPVACDSGDVSDLTAGPGNDAKDAYVPEGLAVPWLFTTGNHDALVMGLTQISAANQALAEGDQSRDGFTDWTQPGGVVRTGATTADPRRKPLAREDFAAAIAADGDGHGLAHAAVAGRSCYTSDVAGTPLRLVVHDTTAEGGGSEGVVRKSVVAAFLKPALDAALADGKWVVLVAHHPIGALTDGAGSDAETQADALAPADFVALLGAYPNIVLGVTGHTHENLAGWVTTGAGAGFWEFQTSSLVDFPNQMRLVEISDADNGHLAISLVGVDFATDDDPLAETARSLAVLDYTSGWGGGSPGALEDRNVILYAKLPA